MLTIEMLNKIEEAYEYFLLENYPDEITCKDDFIEKIGRGYRKEDFIKSINEEF